MVYQLSADNHSPTKQNFHPSNFRKMTRQTLSKENHNLIRPESNCWKGKTKTLRHLSRTPQMRRLCLKAQLPSQCSTFTKLNSRTRVVIRIHFCSTPSNISILPAKIRGRQVRPNAIFLSNRNKELSQVDRIREFQLTNRFMIRMVNYRQRITQHFKIRKHYKHRTTHPQKK